jgi:hypothetical protein
MSIARVVQLLVSNWYYYLNGIDARYCTMFLKIAWVRVHLGNSFEYITEINKSSDFKIVLLLLILSCVFCHATCLNGAG